MKKMFAAIVVFAFVSSACATSSDIFGDVGTNIASPSAMSIDVANNRLYLVNSNSEVLYDPTQGSFQVYDITNPLAPTLIDTAKTLSFSGQTYLNAATKSVFTPNRYTANSSVTEGVLYNINIDETSSDFLTFTESSIAQDAFAIECCYPDNRAWITTGSTEIQYVDFGGSLAPGSISLATTLDNDGEITQASVDAIAIIGNQAFLSNVDGGIMVVNLDEAGVAGAVPVDYFIYDIEQPNGLAAAGNLLYVAGQGYDGDSWVQYLLIIDTSSLTPLTDNTNTVTVDKNDSGILVSLIQVGNNPQTVLLTSSYAFITNQDDDTVSVVDISSTDSPTYRTVVKTIAVDDQPFAMAPYTTLAGEEKYVYVGNLTSNTLSIIDIPSLSVVAAYP